MIQEHAIIYVQSKRTSEFEKVFESAILNITPCEGYISHSLSRCIESPGKYLLSIKWATLEDHTVKFRESENFLKWRSLVSPFFDKTPEVEHYSAV